MSSIDRMLRPEDVAEILQIPTTSVWAKVRSGELPHVRIGRLIRFPPAAIEAVCRGGLIGLPADRGGEVA